MTKYKISVNHDKCIGCGACEENCNNFKLKDEKSNPINFKVDEIGCNSQARDDCPVGAIRVEEI